MRLSVRGRCSNAFRIVLPEPFVCGILKPSDVRWIP
jgi:hypothetical protein